MDGIFRKRYLKPIKIEISDKIKRKNDSNVTKPLVTQSNLSLN